MATTASVALRVTDNMSATLTNIRSSLTPFRRDVTELQRELDGFSRQRVTLQVDLESAKRELAEAKRAFRELEDESSQTRLEQAQEAYNTLAAQLQEVNKAAKATTREMEDLSGALSRTDNRAGAMSVGGSSGDGGEAPVGVSGALSGLAQAGMIRELGQSLSKAAGTFVSSAIGPEMGDVVNTVLGGAASGAALGTMVAPGVGTAIGAGIGALTGGITAGTQAAKNRDDYFIQYYNGIMDQQAEYLSEHIQTGSDIAAGREMDLRGLAALLGGDEDAAADFQRQLIEVGRTPPFSYETALALSRDMLGLGLGREGAMSRVYSLSNAAAALDLSEGDVSSIVSILESAQLAGKLDSRVAKTLSKKGINVYEALADEFGISTSEVGAGLGDLDVERAVAAIYAYMGTRFDGAAAGMTDTYEGLRGILESYQTDNDAAYGAGYNAERQVGLSAEVDAMDGALGGAIQELNQASGALAAYRENLQEQYNREALDALLTGAAPSEIYGEEQTQELMAMHQQYLEAQRSWEEGNEEGALRMEDLREQAEALAQATYDNSEWAKTELTAQEENTKAIRDLTGQLKDGIMLRYTVEQTRQTGLGAVENAMSAEDRDVSVVRDDTELFTVTADGSHASGLWRVPYDDYIARLHEGERVLTAREAREADTRTGPTERGIALSAVLPPAPDGVHAAGLLRVPYDDYIARLHEGERVLTAREAREVDAQVGPTERSTSPSTVLSPALDGTHAAGLLRVPYDDYIAQLHEGERVLTAREAREADAGGRVGGGTTINVNINGNFQVREDGDIDQIAQTLAEQISLLLQAGTF